MQIVATNGQPTFREHELLDKWVIKPWFGSQKARFEQLMKKAQQAAVSAAAMGRAALEDVGDADCEPDEED